MQARVKRGDYHKTYSRLGLAKNGAALFKKDFPKAPSVKDKLPAFDNAGRPIHKPSIQPIVNPGAKPGITKPIDKNPVTRPGITKPININPVTNPISTKPITRPTFNRPIVKPAIRPIDARPATKPVTRPNINKLGAERNIFN